MKTNRTLCFKTRPVLTLWLRMGWLPKVTPKIKKIRTAQKSRSQTVNNGFLIVTLPHNALVARLFPRFQQDRLESEKEIDPIKRVNPVGGHKTHGLLA